MKKHLNGVKVPHHKGTSEKQIVWMDVPEKVIIPMSQQIGPPCAPLVAVGDEVKVGQRIGFTDHPMSVPIHASVSGKVTAIEEMVTPQGTVTKAVVITADKLQEKDPSIAPPVITDHASFVEAVRNSGLVGLGGASFPTFIKLNPKDMSAVTTLVVNAAECEPFITADDRGMRELSDKLFAGIAAVKKYLELSQVIIGVEDNKPAAIAHLEQTKPEGVHIHPLRSRYPQGGEKVLIYETTGKVVGEGKLPADVGVIVMNVTSLITLGHYLQTGEPLTFRCVTVAGSAVANPQNVMVYLGTSYQDVIDFCGGFCKEPEKVFMGGPMMGICVYDLSFPVLKNNNAIVALSKEDVPDNKEQPCIKCGRCVQACPFSLMPAAIDRALAADDIDRLRALKVNLCMECGSCAFVCPAKRQLVVSNKLAKKKLMNAGKR